MIIIKRRLKIKLISHGFIGGLICFLLFPCNLVVNSAWSETSTLSNNPISSEPQIKDVETWGAFRGWSPEVPYGQNSANPIDTENKNEDRQMKEEDLVRNKDDQINSTVSDQSQVEIDEDKSWGAFRNWSPRVPYDN
jgi:hypothetical protein